MKRLFGLISILVLMTCCSETFKSIDPTPFNERIANRTDIATPEDLVKLFYDYPVGETNPNLTITTDTLGQGNFKVTLIHEGIEDDSQAGEKIVFLTYLKGRTWTVKEIRNNWKCWDDRGHTSWGVKPCI